MFWRLKVQDQGYFFRGFSPRLTGGSVLVISSYRDPVHVGLVYIPMM